MRNRSVKAHYPRTDCKIRGPVDAPKYKDFILPLIFLKRLSDVFDEEREKLQ